MSLHLERWSRLGSKVIVTPRTKPREVLSPTEQYENLVGIHCLILFLYRLVWFKSDPLSMQSVAHHIREIGGGSDLWLFRDETDVCAANEGRATNPWRHWMYPKFHIFNQLWLQAYHTHGRACGVNHAHAWKRVGFFLLRFMQGEDWSPSNRRLFLSMLRCVFQNFICGVRHS
jgi:hypothetical protein